MLRLLKIILVLAVLIGATVLGYAFIGDLSPDQEEVREPVPLGSSD